MNETIMIKSHPFLGIFIELIQRLELKTCRRLLRIVVAQETKLNGEISKVFDSVVPTYYEKVYSAQFCVLVGKRYLSKCGDLALLLLYSQILNYGHEEITAMGDKTDYEFREFFLDLFDEFCDRFLDGKVSFGQGSQNALFCENNIQRICYNICKDDGSPSCCLFRISLSLLSHKVSYPNSSSVQTFGEVVFTCIHRYVNMVILSNPVDAKIVDDGNYDTQTKTLTNTRKVTPKNIIQDLLTPYNVHFGHDEYILDDIVLNHSLQILLKCVTHVILQVRYKLFSGDAERSCMMKFVYDTANLAFTSQIKTVFWTLVSEISLNYLNTVQNHKMHQTSECDDTIKKLKNFIDIQMSQTI